MDIEMKILLFLKKSSVTGSTLCPLMGKITLKGKTNSIAQFGCKFKVNAQLWNVASQRCTGKSREAAETNKRIESVLVLLRTRFNELSACNKSFTAEDVKNAFQGIATAQACLLQYFREFNAKYEQRVGVSRTASTCYQYQNTCRVLSAFIRERYNLSDITIRSLDLLFIERFNTFMRIDMHYEPATIQGHIKRLKCVVYSAISERITFVNPFTGFKTAKVEHHQRFLNKDELDRLIHTPLDTPNRRFTRDMFLFSVFTGICYCDMCNLTAQNIVSDADGQPWIEVCRQKTGTPERVKLMDIAQRIIQKYRSASGGNLFPMLQENSMNLHLKKIAERCRIERNLTFHMARHTFATQICLSGGMPIESLSRVMGHRSIRTTMVYAIVTNEKLKKDVAVLEDSIRNRYFLSGMNAGYQVQNI